MTPRLAVRAIIVHREKLLMVNAWPDGKSDLLCAPGGGVEAGASLHENLKREVFEETGLTISVGAVALINEFHDPESGFHQVEIFFRCTYREGDTETGWIDPEGIVTGRYWLTQQALGNKKFKPSSLIDVAWSNEEHGSYYDHLETIVK